VSDPFDLNRFLNAQAGVYAQVVAELRAGQKRSHWIWFIFPQMKGLGFSSHSQFYGIGSLMEAVAYWQHPVLGQRLEECTRLVNQIQKQTIERILGTPDDLKFRSSMTLFSRAAADAAIFTQALDKYFGGKPDQLTLELLGINS
jgi:uncharacterized protein (DUF1810 family)